MKCLYGLLEAARRLQMTSAAVDRPRQATVTTLAGTAIVIADMVGVGVFTSLGFQVKDLTSNFAILSLWFVGGLVALCGAFCYAELAAMFPRSSGEYNFLTRAYSPGTGFLAGWLSATVGFSAPVALAAMAFGEYFRSILPSAPPLISGLAAIWLISSFHLSGIRQGSALQIASTLLKLALIVAFIIAGFAMGGGQSVSFMPKASDSALIFSAPFAMSLVFVMYAYSGWNAATYIVSEIKDPQRSLPKALFLGTGTVIFLYLALNAVFLYTTPVAELAGQLNVAQVVGTHVFNQSGGRIVGALICLGLVSTISAMMWIGPRVTMTMGEDLPMLRLFARRSANGVPTVAICFQLLVASLLLCTGSFEAVLDFIQFSLAFCSFLTVLGMVKLRFTRPDFPRPYRAWGYPLTPVVFMGATALIMCYLITARPLQSFLGFLMMCAGLLLYGLGNLQQAAARRAPAE
jgi:basic amino acid/polyamine antiporter, APA family